MKPQGAHAHEDRLLDFVYGELPPSEARLVEQHVEGCSRCSETLEGIRGVRTTMSRLPLESAPDAGLESLLAYAQQSARRSAAGPEPAPRWWRRLLAPALGVAAMSVLGVVVVQVNRDVDLSPALQKEAVKEQAPRGREDKAVAAEVPAAPVVPAPTAAPVSAEAETLHNQFDDKYRDEMRAESMEKRPPPSKPARRSVQEDWSNAGSAGGFPSKKAVSLGDEKELAFDKLGTKGASSLNRGASVGKSMPSSVSAAGRAEPVPQEALAEAEMAGPAPQSPPAGALQAAQYAAPAPAPKQELIGSASRSAPMASKDSEDDLAQQAPGRARAPSAAPPPPPSAQYQPPAASTGSFAQLEGMESKKADVAQKSREKSATRPVSLPELLRQASQANREGNRDEEVAMLRAALAAGPQGAQLVDVLSRLCDAEFALGNRAQAIENCNRVMRMVPGSSAARTAQRLLEREQAPVDEAADESKAASPVTK